MSFSFLRAWSYQQRNNFFFLSYWSTLVFYVWKTLYDMNPLFVWYMITTLSLSSDRKSKCHKTAIECDKIQNYIKSYPKKNYYRKNFRLVCILFSLCLLFEFLRYRKQMYSSEQFFFVFLKINRTNPFLFSSSVWCNKQWIII